MAQGTTGDGREEHSDENISLLPYTHDDGDDVRMADVGIEVGYRELTEQEVAAVRCNARSRIIEEDDDGFRWGTKTFDLSLMKLAGVLSREPHTEYAYEKVDGMLDVGTRTVVFQERVPLSSGDDALLEISIETVEDSNEVETITVNTLGGATWTGHPP